MDSAPARTPRTAARRLALARLVSVSGSSAAATALSWYLWQTTHSSAWVAAGFLSHSLVLGLASAPAGSLGDRFDRRRVMITSDVLAMIWFAILAAGVWLGAPSLFVVVVMGIAAFVESPFAASSQASIPNLVDDADVPWANALVARVQTVVSIVAPAAGGLLVAATNVSTVLVLNAVSFVGSILLVLSIRNSFGGGEVEHDETSVSDGESTDIPRAVTVRARPFTVAWCSPLLRATVFPGFVAFIGVGFVLVVGPLLADHYDMGAFGLGVISGAFGLGAFSASWVVGRLLTPGKEFTVAVVGIALHGVGMAVVALTEPIAFAVIGLAITGFGAGITGPARQTLIQRHAPASVRAGVFGLMEGIGWTSFALSFVAAGILVDDVGIRWSYGISAILFAAGMALMLFLRSLPERRVDVLVEPAPAPETA